MAEVESGLRLNHFASIANSQGGAAALASLGAITTPGPFIALARSLLEIGVVAPLLPLAEAMLARWPNNERVRSFHDEVADGAAQLQTEDSFAPDAARGLSRLRKLVVDARKSDDRPRLMLLSEIAARAYPDDSWVLENILRVLNADEAFERALQAFDSAPPSARGTCEVMFQAYSAAFRGDPARVAAVRAAALEVFAASAHANLWKGRLLRLEKAREEALAAFALAAQDEPDAEIAIREAASISLALGQIGRNAGYIAKAEAHAPPELAEAIRAARDLLAAAGGSLEAAVAGAEPSASMASPATAFDVAFRDAAATYRPACALMMVGASLAAGGAERIQSTLFAAYRRSLGADAVKLVLFECAEGEFTSFYLPQAEIAPRDILIGRVAKASVREIQWLPKPMAIRVQAIYDHIRATRPAVVHATLDMANICTGYAAVLAGVPRIVLHVHNMRPDELAVAGAYHPDYDHCYRALLDRPEVHLVAVSQATLDDYLDWIGIEPNDRTHVIHNGFDFTEFEQGGAHDAAVALRKSLAVAPSAPLIGTAFRFAELKRPDWWVEIAARLAVLHPDAHFILFGDGELLEETRALAAELGFADRIHFPGRVSNLNELIGGLDLFMLTSRTEGLPNVLIEAQAAGVPVTSFDVGGARDTFADGVTGRLVTEQSVSAMTEAVSELLQSPARLTEMGAAARRYVRANFPVARMVDDLAVVLGSFR